MSQSEKIGAANLEERTNLHLQFGPLIGGKDLVRNLGYKSAAAFRQAVRRGTLPVEVFEIPNRRGKFALTSDIERWLAGVKNAIRIRKGG
jgi:hypothetical protein